MDNIVVDSFFLTHSVHKLALSSFILNRTVCYVLLIWPCTEVVLSQCQG